MVSALEVALEATKRGWYVFPLAAGTKVPPSGFDKPEGRASNVSTVIEQWATQYPNCNWALAAGKSGLVVIDVDVKDGAPGLESWNRLAEEFPELPQTLSSFTPSGGWHFYYTGQAPNSAGTRLGPGIDVRSKGGYVVLPDGQIVGGKNPGFYFWRSNCPLDPREIPAGVLERLGRPRERDPLHDIPLCDLDDPDSIERAIHIAKTCSTDLTGFNVGCLLRDAGLSEDMALEVFMEHHAPRCKEPWPIENAQKKIENAYTYAKDRIGNSSPVLVRNSFEDMTADQAPPLPEDPNAPAVVIPVCRASEIDPTTIPVRDWVLGRRYLRDFVTVLIAPGGQGKSTMVLADAAAIASGRPITGDAVYHQGKVWYYNTEDPQDELDRRVTAMAILHKLTKEDLSNLFTTSGRTHPLILVKDTKDGIRRNEKAIQAIIEIIKREGIILFIVDPFVRLHNVNENDNMAIDAVMQVLARIAAETGCAIAVVHHTKKLGKTSGAGDMDTARGASSMMFAARIAHTLTTMTDAEATTFRVDLDRAKWHVRLDDAKANLSPPGANTRWFERVSVKIPNGDQVGAIKVVSFPDAPAVQVEKSLDLVQMVFQVWTQPITCYDMASLIKKHFSDEYGEWTQRRLNDRIIELFKGVVREHNGEVLTARWGDGKKGKARILVREAEATEQREATVGASELEATEQREVTVGVSKLGAKIEVDEDEF